MKERELMIRPAGGKKLQCVWSPLTPTTFCSSELSSLSEKTLDVHFYEKSFETNQPVAALAVTSTKFGMTAKNIISQSASSVAFRLKI